MKLVVGIVNSDDANELISEMTKASFQVTKLSTSGGFLRMGNVTVLIGVEDSKLDELLSIFKECCSRRTEMVSTAPTFLGEGYVSASPVAVTIGGATIFVLDAEQFIKI